MESIKSALNMLNTGKTGSFKLGNDTVLAVLPNAIVFRFYTRNGDTLQDVLAARVNCLTIGNSSALSNLLRHRTGMSRRSIVVVPEQLALSELVPMIPFSVLKQASLDLKTYRELDKGQPEVLRRKFKQSYMSLAAVDGLRNDSGVLDLEVETIERDAKDPRFNVTYFREQHFAGARLFECSNSAMIQEDGLVETFLLDVDRGELKHGIVNPFLVQLPGHPTSIKEAYESLKPVEVKQAADFERQGEWFFIKVDELTSKRLEAQTVQLIEDARERDDGRRLVGRDFDSVMQGVLRAGNNRPNRVDTVIEVDGKYYVKGTVRHDGREHADLILTGFHRAIPNTATTSWTVTGDVD
jgi:hypothetical protein